MRTCLYSSRNRQVPTVPYQPFLPAIQRSDDGSSLIFRPQETQPFLPAIQRSADGSSNSRESTQSSSPHQPHTSARSPTQPPLPPARSQPAPVSPASVIRHPPSTTKKERPAAHPDHKERSPNFHQLTIIHNHLRSAYNNPIRLHQI